jgi:hypothetical protein
MTAETWQISAAGHYVTVAQAALPAGASVQFYSAAAAPPCAVNQLNYCSKDGGGDVFSFVSIMYTLGEPARHA